MAFFTGTKGSLLLEGNTIASVQNWTVSTTVSVLNTRTLNQSDDFFEPDGRNTSGSCRVLYYDDGSGNINSNNASTFINKVVKARDGSPGLGASLLQGDQSTPNEVRSSLRLKVDDGSANGRYIELRILITNVTLTMSVGEIFAADIAFQGCGAPTFVNI
jgi:hypothetical protein